MYKRLVTLVVILCSVTCLPRAMAQDSRDSVVMEEVIVSPNDEEDNTGKFDSIASQNFTVNARNIDDTVIRQMKSRGEFWYADSLPPRDKAKKKAGYSEPWFLKKWFRNLLWGLLIVLFIIILVSFLASSNIRLFRKKSMAVSEDTAEIDEKNLFTIDYENEIRNAEGAGDYRLATRLWYLYSLKLMIDRNLLQFSPGRTNSHYLSQLYGSSYYKDFSRITRNFDYIWYGGFQLSEQGFATVQKDFIQFKQMLP